MKANVTYLFGSCSDQEPDLDPNEHANQDPDPNEVGSDPQHWVWGPCEHLSCATLSEPLSCTVINKKICSCRPGPV